MYSSDDDKTELERIQEQLDKNYSQGSASHPVDPWDVPTVNPDLVYQPQTQQPSPAIARPVEAKSTREQELEDLVVSQQKELDMYKDLQAKRSQQRERKAMAERQKSNIVTWAIVGVIVAATSYAAYNRFSKPEPPLKVQEPVAQQQPSSSPSPSPTFTPTPQPSATPQAPEVAIAPSPSPSPQLQKLTVHVQKNCPTSNQCMMAAVMDGPSLYSRPIGGLHDGAQVTPTGQKTDGVDAAWVQIAEYIAPDGTVFQNVWVSQCWFNEGGCTVSRNVGAFQ